MRTLSLPALALALALLPGCPGEEEVVKEEVIEPEVGQMRAIPQARKRTQNAEKKMQERANRASAVMDE